MTRLLLAAAALGTLTGLLLTLGTGGAVGVAVCAGAVIVWYGVRAVRRDRRRAAIAAGYEKLARQIQTPEGQAEEVMARARRDIIRARRALYGWDI